MRFYIVKDAADAQPITYDGTTPYEPPTGYTLMDGETYDAWRLNNPEPTVAPQIPWAISNADLRRQLAGAGINPALVLASLNAMDEGAPKWVAVADWEYANYFERAHPLINQLAPAFGLTAEDVDPMFLACPPYPRL
jgi:hypothetical protein